MSLIKPSLKINKSQIRVSINDDILAEMKSYCSWADIDKIDDFVEQAIQFVFSKDTDWKTKIKIKTKEVK